MVRPIQLLDSALVDQIAAGEVVERPASVVKELLENAVDAEATQISVELEEGGRELIRVVDDGIGMDRDNALLAIQRHATSKIRTFEDLQYVKTLGFRGEALPSIASVSRFSLRTLPQNGDPTGTVVEIQGTETPAVRDAGGAPGTAVTVRDLFYNVPARRKFLKARQTESARVLEICLRTALAHPELRLTVDSGGRRVRTYPQETDWAARARAVFRDEELLTIETEREGIGIRAALSAPERARSGARHLFLFVNGRPIVDLPLARAVAFAYGSVIPPGRYPTGVVHLTLAPEEVDVNAHPQKTEVRFARGRKALDAITRALAHKLGTEPWGASSANAKPYWEARLERSNAEPESTPTEDSSPLASALHEVVSQYTPTPRHEGTPPVSSAPPSLGFFGSLRVLGQVRKMLLVCEGADGLHVIDQHAADERVLYHRLRSQYAADDVATQQLLFPERVEVSASEAARIEASSDVLANLGLDVHLVGETTAAVRAIPALLKRAAPDRLLRDALDELAHTGDRAFGDAVDTAIATMACHAAIRAGDELSLEECQALLRALDEIPEFAGHCPHGRPVIFGISFSDLERKLGR